MTILFFGDIFGRLGRNVVLKELPRLRGSFRPDFVIANVENAAAGKGITPVLAEEFLRAGIDVMTSGNHIWGKDEIIPFIEKNDTLLRPHNYPRASPGRGWTVISKGKLKLGVANLAGRVFMYPSNCPFETMEDLIPQFKSETPCIFVDFHAEATSEKQAFAAAFDGQVSAVVGTHTHVQTADDEILPGGTAYLSDVGMCGPARSIIGNDIGSSVRRFVTGIHGKMETAKGPALLCAVVLKLDSATGKALSFQRIREHHEP